MNSIQKFGIALSAVLSSVLSLHAEVKPNSLFADNAVLQLGQRLTVHGSQAVLQFTHAGSGLMVKSGDLKSITIAANDGQFLPAKAEIVGDTVVVMSDQVTQPVAVRHGWDNVPDVNLYNQAGLPASPFRTDVQ